MEVYDLQTVAGALAAMLVAGYAAWKGYSKEQEEPSGTEEVVSGVIQDNTSIRENTEALRAHTRELEDHGHKLEQVTEQMRENKAALIRLADIMILQRGER